MQQFSLVYNNLFVFLEPVVVVDQFTPGYQFTPTPKFIQNNYS